MDYKCLQIITYVLCYTLVFDHSLVIDQIRFSHLLTKHDAISYGLSYNYFCKLYLQLINLNIFLVNPYVVLFNLYVTTQFEFIQFWPHWCNFINFLKGFFYVYFRSIDFVWFHAFLIVVEIGLKLIHANMYRWDSTICVKFIMQIHIIPWNKYDEQNLNGNK
jgi:hypothetical protein